MLKNTYKNSFLQIFLNISEYIFGGLCIQVFHSWHGVRRDLKSLVS